MIPRHTVVSKSKASPTSWFLINDRLQVQERPALMH